MRLSGKIKDQENVSFIFFYFITHNKNGWLQLPPPVGILGYQQQQEEEAEKSCIMGGNPL